MNEWTWAASARLIGRAYCWLVGVTVPGVAIAAVLVFSGVGLVRDPGSAVGIADGDLLGSLGYLLVWDVAVAVVAMAGAVVSLPFTYALGVLLRRVRSRTAHVVATAALAGVLGGVSSGWIWGNDGVEAGLGFGAVVGASTAAAGAIARWRQLVVEARDSTAPEAGPSEVTS